ncbi:hypothetical protein, partial [Comamonas sp. C24C]
MSAFTAKRACANQENPAAMRSAQRRSRKEARWLRAFFLVISGVFCASQAWRGGSFESLNENRR